MAGRIRVAAWNAYNLFPAGVVARGPATQAELDAKVSQSAQIIDTLFNNQGPDLIGLTEVGSQQLMIDVLGQAAGDYSHVWVDGARSTQTGLGLAVRSSIGSLAPPSIVHRPSMASRPRVMRSVLTLNNIAKQIAIYVNHWQSRLYPAEEDRLESAELIKEEVLNDEAAGLSSVLIGDFNADPFEAPMGEKGLDCLRHASKVRRASSGKGVLFNPLWKHLVEQDPNHVQLADNYVLPHPIGAHDASHPALFDGIMVSRDCLRPESSGITLRDETVAYAMPPMMTRVVSKIEPRPDRWEFDAATGQASGGSDHFPIVAEFEIV